MEDIYLQVWKIFQTKDGNYLISSGSSKSPSTNNKIVKVKEDGTELWSIPLDSEAISLNAVMELQNGDLIALGNNEVLKFTSDSYHPVDLALYIQTGPNSNQSVGINIDGMKPSQLGYSDGIPSVMIKEAAALSIEKIDKAIKRLAKINRLWVLYKTIWSIH